MAGRKVLAGTLFLIIAACGGGGSGDTVSPVAVPPPPPPPPPPVNVNVMNPALTVLDNAPVAPGETLTLVWSDEFDGAELDPEAWFFESGDGSQYGITGWGNNELQWYLPDNARLQGGNLVITARRERQNGKDYSSARLSTRDRFAFRYGRIEARIQMPGGQGLWPAFWLLPQDEAYGTWAASGEIDVVEGVNPGAAGGNTIYGTIHYGGESPDNLSSGEQYEVPTDTTSGFHVYAVEWDQAEIRWYVDDTLYAVQNAWSSAGAAFPAPFDQSFYLLLNVAVGGSFPGPPDMDTVFPVTMEVDYVRVYSGEP